MPDAKIYLDLPDELRRLLIQSRLSVADILRREEVKVPIEIREEELPAEFEGETARDIGLVLIGSAALTISIGAAASMVILALSKYFRDREHAPQLVEAYVEKETTGPDGKLRKHLVLEKRFVQPATAESSAQIEAVLRPKNKTVLKFRTQEGSIKATD